MKLNSVGAALVPTVNQVGLEPLEFAGSVEDGGKHFVRTGGVTERRVSHPAGYAIATIRPYLLPAPRQQKRTISYRFIECGPEPIYSAHDHEACQ